MTSDGEVLKEIRNLHNVKKTQEFDIPTKVLKNNPKVFKKFLIKKNIQNSKLAEKLADI